MTTKPNDMRVSRETVSFEFRHPANGETNVVDCRCDEYADEFERVKSYAQPATVKVDERAEFEAWYAGYEKRREQNGWMPLERSQVTRMFDAWQARAKLNGGQS